MVDEAPETIEVRVDERIDTEALAAYLRGKLPEAEGPLSLVQFAGGHANLTYCLRFESTEYVLRRPPLGPLAPSAHDMAREFRVLSVLHRGYTPAPRALLYCDESEVIGAPFLVMERRRGIVVRRTIPAAFGGGSDPVMNRRISEVLIDSLADLHQVDYGKLGLGTLGRPEGFLQRQIDGWEARYERAKTIDQPVVAEISGWLRRNHPPAPAATLLHNDWRLDNIMLAASDPGRCEAVFDWDMCTLGDPLADLGTLLSAWVEPQESLASGQVGMPSNTPGFMSRREAVDRYGARRGVDVSAVPYYYVFGIYKIAIVLQQIFIRYHLGQTRDQRFAAMGEAAALLFGKARGLMDQPHL